MKKLFALVLSLVMAFSLGAVSASAEGEIISVMYGGGTPESMDPGAELRVRGFQPDPAGILRPDGHAGCGWRCHQRAGNG